MASYLTSNTLIKSVKRKENIPSSQATFEDEDFLAFANEEISIGILPSIMQFHEEFLVHSQEIPLVSGKKKYAVPSRAIGGKVRSLFHKDASGTLAEMARIFPEDLAIFRRQESGAFFYLENNYIVLVSDPKSNPGSLLISYYLRPNQLVVEERVAEIKNINRATGEIFVDGIPTVFKVTSKLDMLEVGGGHHTLALDAVPTGINTSTKTITFAPASIPEDLEVGDHIALAGECIIPQIPDDLHTVLSQRVAIQCLKALGDQAGVQAAMQKLMEIEARMGNLIDNRTEGNPQKVTNHRGLLTSGKFQRFRGK